MNRIPIKLIEERPDGTKTVLFDSFTEVAEAKRTAKGLLEESPKNTYTAMRVYGRWGLKTTTKTVLTDLEANDAGKVKEAGERGKDGASRS